MALCIQKGGVNFMSDYPIRKIALIVNFRCREGAKKGNLRNFNQIKIKPILYPLLF